MSVLTETEPGRGALGEAGEGGHWSEGHEGGVREGPEGALPGRGRGRRGREAGKNLVQVAEREGGAGLHPCGGAGRGFEVRVSTLLYLLFMTRDLCLGRGGDGIGV